MRTDMDAGRRAAARENFMQQKMSWLDRPLWVRVGLFGIPSRRAALAWMWGTTAFAILGVIAGLIVGAITWTSGSTMMVVGAMIAGMAGFTAFFSALWYWLAIQWADEHEGWAQTSAGASAAQ
jgi:hypothetical protein